MGKKRDYQAGRKRRVGSAFEIPLEVPSDLEHVLAVDPGSRHCGMAMFVINDTGRWVCESAGKQDPLGCLSYVESFLENPPLSVQGTPKPGRMLVIEEFRLYPTMLQEQALSSLGTVEVIGAMRWRFWVGPTAPRFGLRMQSASIKRLGFGYMERHGVPTVGTNQHSRDAEAHGWHFIDMYLRGRWNE